MDLTEIIQSYVNGSLGEFEKDRFEKQLAQNPDLLARVEKERLVQQMVDDTAMEDLRERMKEIADQEE